MDNKETVGNRLKLIRKELGLTQTEFGKSLGKTLRTIQNWEYEKATPDDSSIRFICLKYDVSFDWLKEGKGKIFKEHTGNSQNIMRNYGIQIQHNGSINHFGSPSNPLTEDVADDVKELFELIIEYGTPKIIKNFKAKMLEIKKLHDD